MFVKLRAAGRVDEALDDRRTDTARHVLTEAPKRNMLVAQRQDNEASLKIQRTIVGFVGQIDISLIMDTFLYDGLPRFLEPRDFQEPVITAGFRGSVPKY